MGSSLGNVSTSKYQGQVSRPGVRQRKRNGQPAAPLRV